MTTLLRLDVHPLLAPHVWNAVTEYGTAHPDTLTVVVSVTNGPGNGRDPSYTAATARLRTRRAGLGDAVLNPGTPPDRSYRDLGAAICVFDGTWERYLHWDGAGAEPGDGHLVHAVPHGALEDAWLLQATRSAGFGMVTDLAPTQAYTELPAWLTAPAPLSV